jgi:hypothetical protein
MKEFHIGLMSTEKGKFTEKTKSKSCKWMRWIKDVLANACSERRGCKALPVGAFVEGELHLSWMQFFPSPFMPLFIFSFKRIIRGYCLGVATSGANVTHK